MIRLLELPGWEMAAEQGGVEVFRHRGIAPVIGYRTVTHHSAGVATLSAFLGEGLLDAFAILNDRFAFGEVLRERPRIVRTGFTMPRGMADREFVHALQVREFSQDLHVVAYGAVDEIGLPAPKPGWIRCPIYPSGQRIRRMADGRTQVEHLMTYELAGRIPRWAQNRLFDAGHVAAYVAEWNALIEYFAQGRPQ